MHGTVIVREIIKLYTVPLGDQASKQTSNWLLYNTDGAKVRIGTTTNNFCLYFVFVAYISYIAAMYSFS